MKYPIIVLLLLTTLSVYAQKKPTSSVKKVVKKTKVVKKVKIVEEPEFRPPNPEVEEVIGNTYVSSENEILSEFDNLGSPVMFNEVYKFGRLDPTIETARQSLGSFISEALKKSDAKDCPSTGSYTIHIWIGKGGTLDNVEPLKSHDKQSSCFLAIRDALMLSTYGKWTPAKKNGENVNCYFYFTGNF